MGKIINYDDFCKEVDKGDLLVGNNAEWAKEIAWRTPAATLPSYNGNEERKMTVQKYNDEYYPKIEAACSFLQCFEHALQKTGSYDEVVRQLRCIGWSEELMQTLSTALECYRNTLIAECKNKTTEK